ncbi:hypothetical protein V6O07_10275, partial [Arthrospira platensis SPKY2]
MKNAMFTLLLMTFAAGAFAQAATASASKASDPRENCLMATGADWARLGIDADQIMRVNAIQSECLQ